MKKNIIVLVGNAQKIKLSREIRKALKAKGLLESVTVAVKWKKV